MPQLSNLNDFDLMALVKQDDEDAYREIYQRYTSILYAHAYAKLQEREEAKDVVQEVLIHLWYKRHSIIFQTNIAGYLYTSLRNRIINKISHRKIERQYIDSLQDYIESGKQETDQLVRTNQLKEIIEREVDNLPGKMREVFKMSRELHLSHREIAVKLGISEKTVKNQVNRALKILRSKLGIMNFLLYYFFFK